ncbi:hypothetical protein [Candidatus Jettenia sp. AMX1]|nr:hypothetical protein [Candidatus Jettenia sp. AMX1]WKZ14460.1 MAG: hypothetical protein QY317_11145 [Candidatus Jettenia caeni]
MNFEYFPIANSGAAGAGCVTAATFGNPHSTVKSQVFRWRY